MPDAAEIHPLVLQLGDRDDLREAVDPLHERILDRRAETPRQRQEARRRQVLVAEEDHQVIQQRLPQRRHRLVRQFRRPDRSRAARRRSRRPSDGSRTPSLRMAVPLPSRGATLPQQPRAGKPAEHAQRAGQHGDDQHQPQIPPAQPVRVRQRLAPPARSGSPAPAAASARSSPARRHSATPGRARPPPRSRRRSRRPCRRRRTSAPPAGGIPASAGSRPPRPAPRRRPANRRSPPPCPAPSTPAPNTRLPIAVPRNGVSAWLMSPTVVKRGVRMLRPDRGGAGDQHRGHDKLGDHRADRRVPARGGEMLRPQPLIGDRRLLVEDHPRHHHRADIGRRQIEIVLVGIGDVDSCRRAARRVGMRGPGDEEERQLEQPEDDRRPLHPPVRPGEHHRQQGDGSERQRWRSAARHTARPRRRRRRTR